MYHLGIMPRTTVDIDAPLLRDLKRLQHRDGRSLGRLVSDLLAEALGQRRTQGVEPQPFEWRSRPMVARFDLADRDAIQAVLERDTAHAHPGGLQS
jgi:hypothetical protein